MKTTIKTILLFAIMSNALAQQQINLPTSLPIPTAIPKGLPPLIIEPTAVPIIPDVPKNPSMNLQEMPVSQLLVFYFQTINNNNYVLSPEIATDTRLISFRFDSKKNKNLADFTKNLISSLGYSIETKSGTYFVSKKADAQDLLEIYKPKYRDTTYLLNALRPIFSKEFTAVAQVPNVNNMPTDPKASPNSATSQLDSKTDILIYHSQEQSRLDKITSMLERLDTKEENLLIQSYIYEVSYSKKDGSAIGLMLNLASNKLNVSFNSASTLDNVIKFSSSSLNLFLSNIATDTRFKMLSNPYLRVRNNQTSSLTVGNSVPTLGNITTTGTGTTQQSVQYQDTGLMFKLTPTIKQNEIDINLSQQISEVQPTTSGVNNTPTLSKRQLETNFSAEKNEVIILGGLKSNKSSNEQDRPFFLPFLSNDVKQNDNTEVIIILEIKSTEDKSTQLSEVLAEKKQNQSNQ